MQGIHSLSRMLGLLIVCWITAVLEAGTLVLLRGGTLSGSDLSELLSQVGLLRGRILYFPD